jgi:uncharacterized protein (DUF885 family)
MKTKHAMRYLLSFAVLMLSNLVMVASAAPTQADITFERYTAKMLSAMWREFPEQGIGVGYYKYADKLTVPNANRRAKNLTFYNAQLSALAKFDATSLSASNQVDLRLIQNKFKSNIWHQSVFNHWQWQPSQYNVGNTLGVLLNTEYAPLAIRLRHVSARLDSVPAYYNAAQANISAPTREHTQLAILQNNGTLSVLDAKLLDKVAASTLTKAEKTQFKLRFDVARNAITGYVDFLTKLSTTLAKDPDKARNFRIGRDLYAQKFAFDIQSGLSVDELHQRAIGEKAALHAAMATRAIAIWPNLMGKLEMPSDKLVMIRAVLDELSKRHTTRDKFVETIRAHIPALETFVRENDLVDQDATRPLVVRETPLYMRGSGAGASISAPGPYDPTANTYYNVTPLDSMSEDEAESYLREYNHWMLQILNIHEAIPGHYTQLMHANKSKSRIKTIFGNGSMIEGWAVFSEKVMLDAGYDNQSPEIWLMWMKWNLRSVVNTILDIEIHTKNMSRDAALTMMQKEAFQQETEATNKWRRATLSQVQLTSYYNGYAEITNLRDEIKQRGMTKGDDKFSVKAFNNQFLSYGSAPVKLIRELMLGDIKK